MFNFAVVKKAVKTFCISLALFSCSKYSLLDSSVCLYLFSLYSGLAIYPLALFCLLGSSYISDKAIISDKLFCLDPLLNDTIRPHRLLHYALKFDGKKNFEIKILLRIFLI